MKKLFFVVCIISLSLFYVGYSANQKRAESNLKLATEYDKKRNQEILDKQKIIDGKIKSYENQKEVTFSEYVEYVSLKNNKVKIAYVGSSVALGVGSTGGTNGWANKTSATIREGVTNIQKDFEEQNYSVGGAKISDLLKNGKDKEIVAYEPDVLFIETGIINSYSQNEGIEVAISSINKFVDSILTESPQSKIIFLGSNPVNEEWLISKSGAESFEKYQTDIENALTAEGYLYFGTYFKMKDLMIDKEIDVTDALTDDVHPNDLGYTIWFEQLEKFLKTTKFKI